MTKETFDKTCMKCAHHSCTHFGHIGVHQCAAIYKDADRQANIFGWLRGRTERLEPGFEYTSSVICNISATKKLGVDFQPNPLFEAPRQCPYALEIKVDDVH